MESTLVETQEIFTSLAAAAVTALCGYLFFVIRRWLGIKESDANEGAIRRASETEAGKLVQTGTISDSNAIGAAASKIIADLTSQVKSEGYNQGDVKDMIIGAASVAFPPLKVLQQILK